MPSVTITIHGHNYEVACGAGQEAHVARLGHVVEAKVASLQKGVGQVGDARLLLLAALTLADELSDAQSAAAPRDEAGPELAQEIEGLARRIEDVADALLEP